MTSRRLATLRVALLALALAAASPAVGQSVTSIDLPVNDVVYDPVSGLLYASVSSFGGSFGNTIVAIDPAMRVIRKSAWVGSEPNRLAVSDDGSVLYVGLDGSYQARRVSLPDLTPGPHIQLVGSDPPDPKPFVVGDIEVQPGHPNVVAIAPYSLLVSPTTRAFRSTRTACRGPPSSMLSPTRSSSPPTARRSTP